MKLSAQHQAWIQDHIESGEFSSPDDAVTRLINERMALEADDLIWARPYIDEARSCVANGDFITLGEHRERNTKRLSAIVK